jgi:hypothetical protein
MKCMSSCSKLGISYSEQTGILPGVKSRLQLHRHERVSITGFLLEGGGKVGDIHLQSHYGLMVPSKVLLVNWHLFFNPNAISIWRGFSATLRCMHIHCSIWQPSVYV